MKYALLVLLLSLGVGCQFATDFDRSKIDQDDLGIPSDAAADAASDAAQDAASDAAQDADAGDDASPGVDAAIPPDGDPMLDGSM